MRSILSRMSQNFDSILPLSCMTWGGETYTLTKPLSKASIIFKNIFRDFFFKANWSPAKSKILPKHHVSVTHSCNLMSKPP